MATTIIFNAIFGTMGRDVILFENSVVTPMVDLEVRKHSHIISD